MGFAIQHFIPLQNGGLANGLGQVAFTCAARTQKQRIFAFADERTCRQVEHQTAVHLRVEGEVEVSRLLSGSRKAACLRRRSSNRSDRQVSSSETRQAIRSMGAIGSA